MANVAKLDDRSTKTPARFLIRPRICAGEWHFGYAVRFALENGFPALDSEVITEILETQLHGYRLSVGSAVLGCRVPYWTLRTGAGREGMRICWSCLKATGYFHDVWRLRGYQICLKHGRPLEIIERAGGTLAQLRRALETAKQGDKANRGEAREPSNVEFSIASQLWLPVLQSNASCIETVLANSILTSELLRGLASARRGKDCSAVELLEWQRSAWWLQNSGGLPGQRLPGVEELLHGLNAQVHRTAAFGLLSKVRERDSHDPTIMSRLPLARWIDLLEDRTPQMFGRGAGGGIPDDAQRLNTVLVKTLADELGVHRRTLRWAMQHCAVRPVAVVRRQREYQLIDRADVPRISAHLKKYMNQREAYNTLNLERRRCAAKTLRAADLLKTEGRGHQLTYLRSSVIGLLRSLHSMVRSTSAPSELLIRFDDPVIFNRRDVRVVRELFDDVLGCRVPIYAHGGVGLSGFSVPIDVLMRLIRRSADFASRPRRDPRQLELSLC